MDCSNNQYGGCMRRPQRPQPPCMNTNCGCESSGAIRPVQPGMVNPMPIKPPQETVPPGREPQMPEQERRMMMPERDRRMPMREERMPMREERMPMREERMPMREGQMSMMHPWMSGLQCRMPRQEDQRTLSEFPIGMGYVPWQRWCQTYPMPQALERGTIFPELDLPFVMGRCQRR